MEASFSGKAKGRIALAILPLYAYSASKIAFFSIRSPYSTFQRLCAADSLYAGSASLSISMAIIRS